MRLWRELDKSPGALQWFRCLHAFEDNKVIFVVLNHVGVVALDEDNIIFRWLFTICRFEGARIIWLEWTLECAQILSRILTRSWGKNHCAGDHRHPQSLSPFAISVGFGCGQDHGSKVFRWIREDEPFAVDFNLGIVAKWHGCRAGGGRKQRETIRNETRGPVDGQERLRWFERGPPILCSGSAP